MRHWRLVSIPYVPVFACVLLICGCKAIYRTARNEADRHYGQMMDEKLDKFDEQLPEKIVGHIWPYLIGGGGAGLGALGWLKRRRKG